MTAPTLSSSRLSAIPNTPCGNSSISPAIALSTPCTRAMPSPSEMMLPTSATSTSTAKLPICSRMILDISSALISTLSPPESLRALAEPRLHLLQLARDARVTHRAANPRDHASDERGVDRRLEQHLPAARAGQAALDGRDPVGGQRRRGG